MKSKKKYTIYIFLIVGFFFGILLEYFSLPSKTPIYSRLSEASFSSGNESHSVNMVVFLKKNMQKSDGSATNYYQTTSDVKPIVTNADIYPQLDELLSRLKSNEQIRLPFDLDHLAKCNECIQLLRDYLLSSDFSDEQLTQLASLLNEGNHPELAAILVDATTMLIAQSGYNDRSKILIDALSGFNSSEVVKYFSDYFLSNQGIPAELEEGLVKVINNSTDREQVASYLAEQFNGTVDTAIREKLLAIGYPESLEKISTLALEQGDSALYAKVIDQIKINPSEHTFNVLLSIAQTQPTGNFDGSVPVADMATEWAYHQLSGSRLDFIENQLAQGAVSEQDKQLVRQILEHSEDQVRGRALVAKFWGNSQGSQS